VSVNKEILEKNFGREYDRLNEKQRLAVDSIEGPVMVIAGPGTGKTQILATRIGKILLETDAYPQNILCLTYTDAGVVAMRKRLQKLIGADAYKVNIYTFHAFCHEVIQENLSLFEKRSLDPISDLEKIELFKQLIDSFPKNHPLKRYRGDVYFEIHNLDKLFSTMKREGWSPSFISQKIDEYISDLSNRDEFVYKRKFKEFNAGDLKKDKIDEEVDKMERLRSAVNEFDRFQQMMRDRNRYDFDDMINWVLKEFRENKNLLATYQEKFLYILVDEYQDTSGAQNHLVELLINYWQRPNVFVVGDDDQSIYRFQGASVENMLSFADTYKSDLLKVVLVNNYRSTQPILDLSKTVIDRNIERLTKKIEGLSKELVASATDRAAHKPSIKSYDTQRQEMIDITLQIEKLIAEDVPASRIGVIYRENRYGDELMQYFKLRNIPFYSKRSINVLEVPLAQKISLLLKYLAAEHDIPFSGDEMLFEILHFDWFHIPSIEIARVTIEASRKKNDDEAVSLRRLLHERASAPPKDLFSQGLHKNLVRASSILEQLIADVPNVTLQTLFENIIRKAGVLTHIMQSHEKIWFLQVLAAFFDFVKDETARNPFMKLKDLVGIIALMEKEDLVLPLVEVCGNEKGVNLMTAHGSKGLEFAHVFFAGCNAATWEKKRKPYSGYKLPDTIFSSTSASPDSDIEELRRLFYVAVTRAEQHLTISYCCFKNDGKELEPSMFIAEILDREHLAVEKVFIDEDMLSEFGALQFGEQTAPQIEEIEKEFVNRLLERFVMNVTALNNYLKCPLEFYFKNLIRIPSPKNEATEFGSAIHHALNELFRKMQNNNQQFPSKEEFIKDFEWWMKRHRESFTQEQYERRMEIGPHILSNYYDKYVNAWNKIVSTERNIMNIVVNEIPLKGKLDKLEFDGKSVNVVDYKTGDPDKAKSKLQPPSDKEPNGGDYWRQAVFYKILVDNYERKGWKVVSTEFDFIEPDKRKLYKKQKIFISQQDIDLVCEQIKTVWDKIQNHDFYIGCGKENCHWCNFVKTNNLTVSLSELQEEETQH
jgi:DNA helicase-2/ATP-dependent DNA helicase PcrA